MLKVILIRHHPSHFNSATTKFFNWKSKVHWRTEFQIYGNPQALAPSLQHKMFSFRRGRYDVNAHHFGFHYQHRGSIFSNRIKCLATHLSERQLHPMSVSKVSGENESFRNWIRLKLDFLDSINSITIVALFLGTKVPMKQTKAKLEFQPFFPNASWLDGKLFSIRDPHLSIAGASKIQKWKPILPWTILCQVRVGLSVPVQSRFMTATTDHSWPFWTEIISIEMTI